MWFTMNDDGGSIYPNGPWGIGRITPAGVITEYSVPSNFKMTRSKSRLVLMGRCGSPTALPITRDRTRLSAELPLLG